MALAVWTYPGVANPALRLAQCVGCARKYTDTAATSSRCPNCAHWVAIGADPALLDAETQEEAA